MNSTSQKKDKKPLKKKPKNNLTSKKTSKGKNDAIKKRLEALGYM